ncbi:response regulator transcription factor [Candidatus Kapabacteria bacterium]|nr:response regulator transcription factor [Candidatus Kapabacteria bacterium]
MIKYTEENPIKIILADDHEVVRAGLRRLLSVDKSIKILDEAVNGKDAVELVKYHKPDIALLDILMPTKTGIEAALEIKNITDSYVVMLTAYEDSYHLEQALSAGADGYLAKDIGAKELISSIHSIMHGERAFSKSIIKIMQKKYVPTEEQDSAPVIITKREQEILNLVALGKTSQEIADELFISIRTVESHRYNIMQKLDIKNTAGLVRYSVMNVNISKK